MKRAILFLPFFLVGCADNYIPITGEMMGTSTSTVGYIRDASVAKELAVHATLRNRDRMYRQMYADSGTKVVFEMREVVEGVHVQFIKEITSRDPIAFRDALPTAPSEHPVWGVIKEVTPALINATLIGTLGYHTLQTLDSGWKATAPVYNGPYQSYNPITTTEVVPGVTP